MAPSYVALARETTVLSELSSPRPVLPLLSPEPEGLDPRAGRTKLQSKLLCTQIVRCIEPTPANPGKVPIMQWLPRDKKPTPISQPKAGLTRLPAGLKVQTRVKVGPGPCMFCPK
jgi:hypothetical protein